MSYRYAIGVTADDQLGEYVQGWTNTNSASVNQGGLSLVGGARTSGMSRQRAPQGRGARPVSQVERSFFL